MKLSINYVTRGGVKSACGTRFNFPIALAKKLEWLGKELELVETNNGVLIREKVNEDDKNID